MFPFELLAIVYFTLFGVGALLSVRGRLRSFRAALCAAAAVTGVMIIASKTSVSVRAWMPHAYLVVGYWLPALLVGTLNPSAFEAWLMRTDARLRRHIPPLSDWATHLAELSYLMCYPAVPVAFIVVWTYGDLVDTERFWVSVLAAGFLCYGNLPWLPSRPPRLVHFHGSQSADMDRGRVASKVEPPQVIAVLNVAVLARVSHQLNTFPSGHVAVSVAAAASAFAVLWPAGLALAIVAVGVAAGAIVGRYHYVLDVVLGVLVGVIAVVLGYA